MIKKLTHLFIFLLLLILLLYVSFDSYFYFDNLYPSVRAFYDNPEKYDGIIVEKVGVMKDIKNDTFTLIVKGREVLIKSLNKDIKPVKKGTVIVHGIYNKGGYIDMMDIHYSHYHYVKYFISFIALIIMFVYLVKEWKITRRGFTLNA